MLSGMLRCGERQPLLAVESASLAFAVRCSGCARQLSQDPVQEYDVKLVIPQVGIDAITDAAKAGDDTMSHSGWNCHLRAVHRSRLRASGVGRGFQESPPS